MICPGFALYGAGAGAARECQLGTAYSLHRSFAAKNAAQDDSLKEKICLVS